MRATLEKKIIEADFFTHNLRDKMAIERLHWVLVHGAWHGTWMYYKTRQWRCCNKRGTK